MNNTPNIQAILLLGLCLSQSAETLCSKCNLPSNIIEHQTEEFLLKVGGLLVK